MVLVAILISMHVELFVKSAVVTIIVLQVRNVVVVCVRGVVLTQIVIPKHKDVVVVSASVGMTLIHRIQEVLFAVKTVKRPVVISV